MGKAFDLTGKKFWKLTAINKTEKRSSSGSIYWLFKCECGKEKIILGKDVVKGVIKSCGCFHSECARIQGLKKRIHDKNHNRILNIWSNIKSRCNNVNSNKYKRYGGRGITICEEWNMSSISFVKWALANGYKDNLTIDRIDNNGNYEPNNCRWVTQKVQQRNKSTNHYVSINGERMCLAEVAEKYKINANTLKNRVRLGRDINELISEVI